MLILEEAIKIARAYLSEFEFPCELVLILEKTIELENGFIFYWDSKEHAKDGMTNRILGSTPFIVRKKNGTIYRMGYNRTAREIELFMEREKKT